MDNRETPVWIIVGAGGTTYCMMPYLAVLLRRWHQYGKVIVVDPDNLSEENRDRQWATRTTLWIDTPKVELVANSLVAHETQQYVGRFKDHGFPGIRAYRKGQPRGDEPLVMVVNPDNDRCRLACRNWAMERPGTTLMVVTGCEVHNLNQPVAEWRGIGQAYAGVYGNHPMKHDWLESHCDVGEKSGQTVGAGGCGGQTIWANARTALLGCELLEELYPQVFGNSEPDEEGLREKYWTSMGWDIREYDLFCPVGGNQVKQEVEAK